MVNHFTLCRSIKYDYMNILTGTMLKKTQISNGCETFAFKYIKRCRLVTYEDVCHSISHNLISVLYLENNLIEVRQSL